MKKIIMFLFLGLFLITLANAQSSIYKLNETTNITVVCINGGYCSNSSYCNINIEAPNGSLIVSGKNMTYQTSFHNYTITPTSLGIYNVGGFCIDGNYSEEVDFSFLVTPNGEQLSTGSGILYSLFSLVLFGILCVISWFIIALPYDNERDEDGFATKIVRLKYLRPIFIVFFYIISVLLLNFLNGISVNFSSLSMFSGILGFLFETMLRISWPFAIIIIAWIIYMAIKDTNVSKQLDRFEKFDPFKGQS